MMNIQRLDKNGNSSTDLGPIFVHDRYGRLKKIGGPGSGGTAPASATAAGTLGDIRVTATHIYVCTATNVWVRASLATW